MVFYNWRNVDRKKKKKKSGAVQYEYQFFKFSLRFDVLCLGSTEDKTVCVEDCGVMFL